MGERASFGDNDFIAHEQVDLLRPIHLVPEEHPKQHGPRYHRREKALNGPVTAAFTGPAREPQHRYTACHHQHGRNNPTELA